MFGRDASYQSASAEAPSWKYALRNIIYLQVSNDFSRVESLTFLSLPNQYARTRMGTKSCNIIYLGY